MSHFPHDFLRLGAWGKYKEISVTESYSVKETDYSILIDASTQDVVVTLPDISTLKITPRFFKIKRIDSSMNKAIISLATPSDSLFGPTYSSLRLDMIGDEVSIDVSTNLKYDFSNWGGTAGDLPVTQVSTLVPSESLGSLIMEGALNDLGATTFVNSFFRYRDVTAGGVWIEVPSTTGITSSDVLFSETVTVTPGNIFYVQAFVENSATNRTYGDVKVANGDYYIDVSSALANNLEFYLPFQETTGTDTVGAEFMSGNNMLFANGVTIGNDIINGNTLYKRIFGNDDWGESLGYRPDFEKNSYTILLQILNGRSSQEHPMLTFGASILTLGSTGNEIQLTLGYSTNEVTYMPMSSIENIFIQIDKIFGVTRVFTVTNTLVTQLLSISGTPDIQANYVRLGRGANGDPNYQDYEYLDQGEVRSLAIWKNILSKSEMKDIAKTLDVTGKFLVS